MLLFLFAFFIEYCLLSPVWAGPVKGSGSSNTNTFAESSASYSPYRRPLPDPRSNKFFCPNGHSFNKKQLTISVAILCGKIHLHQEKYQGARRVLAGSTYHTWEYPIDQTGTLLPPTKGLSSQYYIWIHQFIKHPEGCALGTVFWRSNNQSRQCPLFGHQAQPVVPDIKRNGKFNCNGKIFEMEHILMAMDFAKKKLNQRMTKLELAPKPTDEYPIPLQPGIFKEKDVWIFPLLPDGKTLYVDGDPGPYAVVIKGNGARVGAVYKKAPRQIGHNERVTEPLTAVGGINEYAACRVIVRY